ncbi:MAG: aminoacetone oxidase family FAD-binding enzyme [Clostridia bacterium]|nr:aminoacetone oxidase family FAD-binding enzyme [Clostridia bacterium]
MQNSYKTIIVGGGASGLLCAVELLSGETALNGKDVCIIERTDRVGKKLIATGNGQGNLCNANFSLDFYHGENGFIRIFADLAEKINLRNYLENLGVPLTVAKDGKIYPLSKQASSVLDVIRAFLEDKGVVVITDTKIEKITEKDGLFTLFSDNKKFYAEKVVLAVGGKSAKQFGTDGSSYSLATSFGHKLTELYPSLVQLKTDLTNIRGLKGLKETVKLTAYDGERELKSSAGEILFTEYGVSGNAVFQVSGYLTDVKNPKLKVEFLPEYTKEEVENMLAFRESKGYFKGELLLAGIVNKRIGQAVVKSANSKGAKQIAHALKNFVLTVVGDLGFNYSQVTKGGIQTSSVNPFTMESKLARNLYLTGEVLDVDGDCGGYNLTFAFVSGILSARAIKSKFTK